MTVKTGTQILAADVYPLVVNAIPGGRLTLATGEPDTLADQADKTALYYSPHVSDKIALFDGTDWNIRTFTELTLDISGFTASKPYDIFIFDNAGTPAIEGLVWTNKTTRATALARQNGVLVKSGAAARRYVGTIYMASDTKCDDSETERYVWNYYNRICKMLYKRSNTANDAWFVIGDPKGQYVQFGAGGSFAGDASVMMYLRSTVEPSGSAPYTSEVGNQHTNFTIHGGSQTEVGQFSTGLSYIGWDKGGSGTITYGHLWAELWC